LPTCGGAVDATDFATSGAFVRIVFAISGALSATALPTAGAFFAISPTRSPSMSERFLFAMAAAYAMTARPRRGYAPPMRAAVHRRSGDVPTIEEVELDAPKHGEVSLRMAASGVCRSDWHAIRGIHPHPVPVILGHEGSGVVETVGDGVDGLAPGDHVVCSWIPYCGTCPRCASGRPALCERLGPFDDGFLGDGTTRFHVGAERIHHNVPSSFAERSVVPASTAIKVDASLPLEEVALLGCAVMTGVGAVINTARVRPGDTVVVIGCGGVGLSIVQGARVAGAGAIVAVDVVDAKLELASALGATVTIRSAGDVAPRISAATDGGADFAFEALGRAETIELATRVTRPGGTAVLVGMAPPDVRVPLPALDVTVQERTVTGSWYGSAVPPRDFPMLAGLLARGELRVEPLIARRIGLDDLGDALGRFAGGEETRSVIVHG
jgi:S-(hydroxymethyl)glutathione dehydrogenase/alcohol dehydrogenase